MTQSLVAAQLVIIRHASTEWSENGRHTGRTDLPLDDAGRQAAARLTSQLAALEVRGVFSSPLSRALETCQIAGFGDRVQLADELMEWDYGDYEGLTTVEIRATRPDWDLFSDGCPGGEAATDVGARVDTLLESVSVSSGGEGVVLCFAHGHVSRVMAARWIGLSPDHARHFIFDPARLGVLGFERQTRALVEWNI